MAMVLTFQVNAQTQTDKSIERHEVNLGVGVISTNQVFDFLAKVIVTTLTFTAVHPENTSYTATWHAGYKYSLSKRWAIGPTFVYDGSTSDAIVLNHNVGTISNNYYTLALETDFKFVNTEVFKFYSLFGIGGTLLSQEFKESLTGITADNSIPYFNFQITPIGLKFGKTFGAYTELGIGYKGIINAGLFYRF